MSEYRLPPVTNPRVQAHSPQVLVDHEHSLVWVIPPKCAQTSLRKLAGPECDHTSFLHNVAALLLDPSWRLVMSVRNPFHRFQSAWKNKYSQVPFPSLMNTVLSHHDIALDIHLQSQAHLLTLLGVDWPDHYLRVGPDLESDVGKLAFYFPHLEGRPLLHENKSGDGRQPNILECSSEVLQQFQFRYARDFQLWEDANDPTA
jgi:hypothetical protein